MFRPCAIAAFLLLALSAICVAGDPPYEIFRRASLPYMAEKEPFGFPMRIYWLSQDPLSFWREGPEHFYAWCRANSVDWCSDLESIMPCQGALDASNLGSYPAAGPFGKLAFGLV